MARAPPGRRRITRSAGHWAAGSPFGGVAASETSLDNAVASSAVRFPIASICGAHPPQK